MNIIDIEEKTSAEEKSEITKRDGNQWGAGRIGRKAAPEGPFVEQIILRALQEPERLLLSIILERMLIRIKNMLAFRTLNHRRRTRRQSKSHNQQDCPDFKFFHFVFLSVNISHLIVN